jgi:ribose 5-phosphate isomerase B
MSNDCQIMAIGSRVVGGGLAKALVDVWLKSEFQAGRSRPKVERLKEIEKSFGGAKQSAVQARVKVT